MKARKLLIICLFAFPMGIFAQMVNHGAQITVTAATTVSGIPDFANNGSLLNDGELQLLGTFQNQAAYNGAGEITLVGNSQSIDVNDTVSILTLSGTGNHSLASSLRITGEVAFNNSKLVSNDLLRLSAATTVTNASTSGYIIGSLSIEGTADKSFPVGTESAYLPIKVSSISGSDLTLTIETVAEDPLGIAGTNLLEVANDKYWDLTATGTLTEAAVALPLSDETIVSSLTDLRIAYSSSGEMYTGLAVSGISGDLLSGEISSVVSAAGRLAFGRFFDESLRKADSLALVQLYDETTGNSWTVHTGWKEAQLDDWFGVTMANKRPVALELPLNNLSGNIGSFDAGLERLGTIDLSGNDLTSIAGLEQLPAISSLNISANRLQFGDIEPHLGISSFIYLPQGEVLDSLLAFEEIGTTYSVNRTVSGSSNQYQWFKLDNGVVNEVSTTTAIHDISVSSFDDEGYYYAEVSSEVVTDLTLTTRPVRLKVSSIQRDSLALVKIYDQMRGDIWTAREEWLQGPLDQWTGVTVSDSRVSELILPSNNVSGKLPEDILDIRQLIRVDLSGNRVSSVPDFHELPNLTSLDLSENNLDFGDLESLVDLSFLTYSPQRKVGSVLVDTLAIGSIIEFVQAVGGTDNVYQWYFEGIEDTFQIAGANTNSYELVGLGYSNMGSYTLNVTNPAVPNLTISSFPKSILASSTIRINAVNQSGTAVNDGTAYLFKIEEGQPYDSLAPVIGGTEGYIFEDVVLGDYLALVEEDLDLYLPTYYSNTDLWSEATPIALRGDFDETITLVSQPGVGPAGPGEVLGTVESEFEEESTNGRIKARRKVKRAGCSVRRFVPKGRTDQEDGEFQLVAYVQSVEDGKFEFNDLVAGLYRFNVEYPGIPMDEDSYVEFEVGEEGSENDRIVLEILITEDAVTVIKVEELGFFSNQLEGLKVYPNPANEYLNLSYDKLNSKSVEVQLMNLSGEVLKTQEVDQFDGNELSFDVTDLADGMYLLHFKDHAGQSRSKLTYKVLVNHR